MDGISQYTYKYLVANNLVNRLGGVKKRVKMGNVQDLIQHINYALEMRVNRVLCLYGCLCLQLPWPDQERGLSQKAYSLFGSGRLSIEAQILQRGHWAKPRDINPIMRTSQHSFPS